jgi:hypothetical protein
MFKAIIKLRYSGSIEMGPTDSRDEASRLARAWIEANPGSRNENGCVYGAAAVSGVVIERVDGEKVAS